VKVAHINIIKPGHSRKYRAEGLLTGSSSSNDL
jgi:hypothetical protein